jgi:hypothetical protein
MLLFKLRTSASFRCLAKQQEIRQEHLGEKGMAPCNNSICNWLMKIGLYTLTSPKVWARDWVIILDTSIQMGQEKVLVILGIRQREIDFTRPLVFTDLVPLSIVVSRSWTGESVKEELEKLQLQIGKVAYAVADHGSELRKGLRLAGISHLHDITHALALLVEKMYREDSRYKAFCTKLSDMRTRLSQSEVAHIAPPLQRKKSPYQNIRPIVEFACMCLDFLNSPEALLPEQHRVVEEMSWLCDFEELLAEMKALSEAINAMEKVLKHKGLSLRTAKECEKILSGFTEPRLVEFGHKFMTGLRESLAVVKKHRRLLCTSDIIESIFAAYKNFVSNNKMAGVTKLVLAIAALTCDLTDESIKKGLEKVTIKQVKNWGNEVVGQTLYQKRRQMKIAS